MSKVKSLSSRTPRYTMPSISREDLVARINDLEDRLNREIIEKILVFRHFEFLRDVLSQIKQLERLVEGAILEAPVTPSMRGRDSSQDSAIAEALAEKEQALRELIESEMAAELGSKKGRSALNNLLRKEARKEAEARIERFKAERRAEREEFEGEHAKVLKAVKDLIILTDVFAIMPKEECISRIEISEKVLLDYYLEYPGSKFEGEHSYYLRMRPYIEQGIEEAQIWKDLYIKSSREIRGAR